MEVLERGKPLIVIVNDKLMGNHQVELAERLAMDNYLVYGSITSLSHTIENFPQEQKNLKPYPLPNVKIFTNFVNRLFIS